MSSHLHGRLAQLQKSIYIHLPLIMRIIILDLLSLNNMLKVYDKIWKFCGERPTENNEINTWIYFFIST